jgi:hypothetical protein
MDMPKPTPGHTKLEKLAGHWEGTETMYPSRWDPKGGTATGRMKGRIELGGFAMISDYTQERGGVVTFSGHSVMSYDAKEDLYSLHWFDSIGSHPEIFTGRFKGDVLTVAHGGPGAHARLTYDVSDPKEMVSKMESSQDGKSWLTLFDGKYNRR